MSNIVLTLKMSCGSCSGGPSSQLKEGFGAGMPPYLGYSGYPGSDFPKECGGGYGYGGYGHYGTYGGCATYDHYDIDNSGAAEFAELDSESNLHEPGCYSPQSQTPYSMPYHANPKACGNPYCKCGDCDGNCACGAGGPVAASHGGSGSPISIHGNEGHNPNALFDLGFSNGNGLKGHVGIPGFNVHVDFNALLKYVVLILIVSTVAYYLLGLRLR